MLPADSREDVWFRRVLRNLVIDELRRRHGRRQSTATGEGWLRHVVLLSEIAERGFDIEDDDVLSNPEVIVDALGEDAERANSVELARGVLEQLPAEDVRLLLIRHVEMPTAGRRRCAEAAGITEEAWRHRYARAWKRFVQTLDAHEPTARCGPTRALIGALDAGGLSNGAARTARAQIDVHIVDCMACRVFARDTYRILKVTPYAPAGVAGMNRLVEHTSSVIERHGAEAAGAAAGGAGLWALFGAGGLSSGLKLLIVVCGLSATAAGVCGGILAVVDDLPSKPHAQREERSTDHAARRTATPQPTATVITIATRTPARTPTPRPKRVVKPVRTAKPTPTAYSTAPPEQAPPAAVAAGTTGGEFDPVPESASSQPAPVPAGVQSEFSP